MSAVLDRFKATEPARLAEFVRTVLAALVAVGWVTINDGLINTIASLIALGFSALLTRFVRNHVTPVANPHDVDGTPLVPIPGAPITDLPQQRGTHPEG